MTRPRLSKRDLLALRRQLAANARAARVRNRGDVTEIPRPWYMTLGAEERRQLFPWANEANPETGLLFRGGSGQEFYADFEDGVPVRVRGHGDFPEFLQQIPTNRRAIGAWKGYWTRYRKKLIANERRARLARVRETRDLRRQADYVAGVVRGVLQRQEATIHGRIAQQVSNLVQIDFNDLFDPDGPQGELFSDLTVEQYRRFKRAIRLIQSTSSAEPQTYLRHRLYGVLATFLDRVLDRVSTLHQENPSDRHVLLLRFPDGRVIQVNAALINRLRAQRLANTVNDPFLASLSDAYLLADMPIFGSDVPSLRDLTVSAMTSLPNFSLVMRVIKRRRKNRRIAGAWAPWFNYSIFDLSTYQVCRPGKDLDLALRDLKEHCFIYALRMSNVFSEDELLEMALRIYGFNLSTQSIRTFCEDYDFQIELTVLKESGDFSYHTSIGRSVRVVQLAFMDGHYFLNDSFMVSPWVLDNIERAKELGSHPTCGWGYLEEDGRCRRDPSSYRTSASVMGALKKHNMLGPIDVTSENVLLGRYYRMRDIDMTDLSYAPQFCHPIENRKQTSLRFRAFFADFETTTDGDMHLPYLLCIISDQGQHLTLNSCKTRTSNVTDIWTRKIDEFLEWITLQCEDDELPIVYFHNLNYDMAFLIPFLPFVDSFDVVEVNGRVIAFSTMVYSANKTVRFRDSYMLITAPLRAFASMFKLEVAKEVFPYNFYTQEAFKKYGRGITQVPFVDYVEGFEGDQNELKNSLETSSCLKNDVVDALAYSRYYCMRDCEVLRYGICIFREQLLTVTGLDCYEYLTLPSLAFNYLISQGVFNECFNLTARPLLFIRSCVLGGRCMLQRNEKKFIRGHIADFDAVSLYPSAMARIYTLKGLPKIIEGSYFELSFLREHSDGFFVYVHIKNVPRALDFPLLSSNTNSGVKQYLNVPGFYYLDDISLESIQLFHEVTDDMIEIIRGYYFNEGKNYRIREVITHIFEQRVRLKKEKNPLEQVYKLLMNSCYGKSIMRPIEERVRVVGEDRLERELETNMTSILSYRQVMNKYILHTQREIVASSGVPTFGVHVLAMSKRIMSEVMVLAQDLGQDIYYTDTDSMHLAAEDIEPLAQAFKERYNRELIGNCMGQFHTDFPNHPVTKEPTCSRLFIGVGKKCYLDELETPSGAVTYHLRLKGVPEASIREAASRQFAGSLVALYEHMRKGHPVTFNLLVGRTSFKLGNDMTYTTREQFERCIVFPEE